MELHVCLGHRGTVYHALRRETGTWTQARDLVSQVALEHPGSNGPVRAISDVACATQDATGELHVVVADANLAIWHAIRYADGKWSPFGNVGVQVSGFIGGIVGCSDIGGGLQVTALWPHGGSLATTSSAIR